MGPVVAGEPDLVHPVVKANDSVLRNHLPDIVHDALRRQRKAAFLRPIGHTREDRLAQPLKRSRPRQLALETVGEQREAGADIADDLHMRKEHLLDCRREIADMEDRRPFWPHEEKGRLSSMTSPMPTTRPPPPITR